MVSLSAFNFAEKDFSRTHGFLRIHPSHHDVPISNPYIPLTRTAFFHLCQHLLLYAPPSSPYPVPHITESRCHFLAAPSVSGQPLHPFVTLWAPSEFCLPTNVTTKTYLIKASCVQTAPSAVESEEKKERSIHSFAGFYSVVFLQGVVAPG